jgi:hemolysin III
VLIKSLTLPPEWLSVTFYVLMGWFGVVLLPQFLSRFPITAIIAMVIGGLMYTFGVPFYASRKLKIGIVGAHEIWHGFVLAGSISHFVMMMNLQVL